MSGYRRAEGAGVGKPLSPPPPPLEGGHMMRWEPSKPIYDNFIEVGPDGKRRVKKPGSAKRRHKGRMKTKTKTGAKKRGLKT